MNSFTHVPPGFRFHPTDEELVDYYLRKKITSRRIDLDVIKDVDLYKIEPWDLQEICRIGTEEQNEWYFFSHKDKKYPTGTRTNRATAAGFWKATGRDKAIYAKHDLIGMRKTLVFYKGRAPNGQKSDWIMHEYRLETDENGPPQEEGWVVCRVFKKRIATMRRVSDHESPCWFDHDQVSFMQDLGASPKPNYHNLSYACKKELDLQYQIPHPDHHHPQQHFLQLPLLETTSKLLLQTSSATTSMAAYGGLVTHQEDQHSIIHQNLNSVYVDRDDHDDDNIDHEQAVDHAVATDWRVFDKFVASQLSTEDHVSNENNNYSSSNAAAANNNNILVRNLINKEQTVSADIASTSTSSCQIDLWK